MSAPASPLRPPPRGLLTTAGYGIACALFLFGVVFFLQTRDPRVIVFGAIAAGVVALLARGVGAPGAGRVAARCRECRAPNPEGARSCNECGKPM